jgi:hypothetical protein
MSNIWYSQSLYPKEWILLSVEQRLKDQFKQKWCTEINMSSKGFCYKLKKNELVFEKYLSILHFTFLFSLFVFVSAAGHYFRIWTGQVPALF